MKRLICHCLRAFFFRLSVVPQTLALRAAYAMVVDRIRRRAPGTKIRVLFFVSEISKWKSQSLYDLMAQSDEFEPMIGVTLADFDIRLPIEEQKAKMQAVREYFSARSIPTVDMYDFKSKAATYPVSLGADIVFYQQPYLVFEEHSLRMTCLSALTCYIPYYVTNYGSRSFDYTAEFHRQLWRYFILNEDFARAYRRGAWFTNYAGKLLGLGHTGLDYYYLHRDEPIDEKLIVYAPHWSFSHPKSGNIENYSTFLWTGDRVLEYAKKHPEFKWVFRPHPTLLYVLQRTGAWTQEHIDRYWAEWQRIGRLSTEGNYQELLLRSRAMITDCGSFLTEYFALGKPLIHLISKDLLIQPSSTSKRFFDTFYQVRSEEELEPMLDKVLVRGVDDKGEDRSRALERSGLLDCYAAKNIFDYLNKELRRKG